MRMHLKEDALEVRAELLESSCGTIAGCQQMATMPVCYRGCRSTCFSSHHIVERRPLEKPVAKISSDKPKLLV
jgi:hypothetical protein